MSTYRIGLLADLGDIEGAEYPAPLTISGTVTQVIVTKAINRPKKDKAPGPNKIPNRFLSIVTTPFAGVFTHLFQAYLDIGYYPRKFKEARTIILKKPLKPDYSEIKAYRPITLLYILGKALETIIIKILSDYVKEYDLFPD